MTQASLSSRWQGVEATRATALHGMLSHRELGRGKVLEDDEDQDEVYVPVDEERREAEVKGESIQGTWLEGDDIEDS